MSKRIFDIMISSIALVMFSPFLLLVAILVKMSSRGPIIYKSKRIGQNRRAERRRINLLKVDFERRNGDRRLVDLRGKPFYLLKFRTMVPDADQIGPVVTCSDDPRITKVGALLRRTKLDEVPSLINVIKGDMSLVGPRPESPSMVAQYTEDDVQVLKVKPGITGWSQIKYRNEEQLLSSENLEQEYQTIMQDKLQSDMKYVNSNSRTEDVKILFKTIKVLFE